MADAVATRRRERERLIETARRYVERLAERVPVAAAAVVGSVARGDFNVWSDVDVVVVAADLPARAPDRQAVLGADAPGGVQAIGFTPAELAVALERRNPLALALDGGEAVVIAGDAALREALGR